jgi:hypothetical protein
MPYLSESDFRGCARAATAIAVLAVIGLAAVIAAACWGAAYLYEHLSVNWQ